MLSPGAGWLWLRAGSWSAQQLTDGFIPTTADRLLGDDGTLAGELVEAGLWEVLPDGWAFHGWDEFQPSRDEVMELRRKRSEAGRRGGRRSGEARRSKREANGEASASRLLEAKSNPVPSRPVPTPDSMVTFNGHLSERYARETIDDHSQLAGFFRAKHIDPDAVAAMIQDRLGIQLTAQGVFHLFSDLQMDAKATIANGQAYIRTALKETPGRVEKLICERGDAA
jgi:hypothetical protein